MSLPRSVQNQIDRAAEIQGNLGKPVETENPADAAPEETGEQPKVEPDAQPAEKPKQVEPELADGKPASYWKHRFDVLQGKYNAEVPALRKEVTDLQKQIQEAAKPDGSAVERAQNAMADLTKDEIEEFGPELVNLIQRVAGNVAKSTQPDPEVQEMRDRLKAMDDERQQDIEATFWSDLETQVPDFRQVNADPAFHAWLAAFDQFTGVQRQQLLAQAQKDWKAAPVIALFNAFKQEGKPQQRKVPDDQVSPPSAGGSGNAPAAQAKIWTRAEINTFYREKTSGRYTPDEAKKIEADIFAAQTEGRIR